MRNTCPFLARKTSVGGIGQLPKFFCGVRGQEERDCTRFPFRTPEDFMCCEAYKHLKDLYYERVTLATSSELDK